MVWYICIQVKKQQLELDMEQQSGSKSGKEYVKAVYCHPASLTYMQSILCKMPGWMKQRLESTLNIHWKKLCWSWSSNTLATWYEELTHWKSPWCWERLRASGEEDDREGDGWMASPTQQTRVWADCRRQRRTGKPGVLQSVGSQRMGHDLVTEQHCSLWGRKEWDTT